MKTFRDFIDDIQESSMSRLKSQSDKGGTAVMSASRGDKSKKENRARAKKLDKDIRSKFARKGYSARTTPEEKLAAYQVYLSESYDSQNKLFQTLENAKELGVTKNKLRKIFDKSL